MLLARVQVMEKHTIQKSYNSENSKRRWQDKQYWRVMWDTEDNHAQKINWENKWPLTLPYWDGTGNVCVAKAWMRDALHARVHEVPAVIMTCWGEQKWENRYKNTNLIEAKLAKGWDIETPIKIPKGRQSNVGCGGSGGRKWWAVVLVLFASWREGTTESRDTGVHALSLTMGGNWIVTAGLYAVTMQLSNIHDFL